MINKISLLLIVCVVVFSGCQSVSDTSKNTELSVSQQLQKLADRDRVRIGINGHELEVEVVTTPTSITQGLSGRDSIGADGMLFVMPERNIYTFWMIDMKMNLDLVWIDSNSVVDITTNALKPAPNTDSKDLPVYKPTQPVTLVLEIPAGKVAELGIQKNDIIEVK